MGNGARVLWMSDAPFVSLMKRIEGRTLVDPFRCHILWQLVKATQNVPGDLAEVGVYKGGTALLLAEAIPSWDQSKVHLFDTFSGMPSTALPGVDIHKAGDFHDTSVKDVEAFLAGNQSGSERFRIYPGFFPESANRSGLPDLLEFSFVHVDVDIYQSVLDCCKWFYPKLSKGGIMVFDDYGFPSCPGAKKAVDEYFVGKPSSPVYLPTGQCVVMNL